MLATVAERYPRSGTLVFGLMGSAGAACTYVVLPIWARSHDRAKLAAAGGDADLAANAQGAATARHPGRRGIGLLPGRSR